MEMFGAIRNPQPATRNPQPATRNPQPATRNPFYFLVSLLLLLFALFSCQNTDSSGPEMKGDLQTLKQAFSPSTALGLGASWNGDGQEIFEIKVSSCLPSYEEKVGPNYKTRFAAGLISQTFQIEANLELAVGGDFEVLGHFDIGSVKNEFEATLDASSDAKIFYVIVRIDTAKRWLEVGTGNDNQHPTFCGSTEGVGADFFDWVQECGTHYVVQEDLGGLAVLWLDYSELDATKKAAVESSFDMEVPLDELAGGSVNLGLSFDSLLSANLGGLHFRVHSKGLANPLWGSGTPSDDWETFGEAFVEEWVAYLNDHYEDVSNAVDNNEIYASVLGVPLNTHLKPYTAIQYQACGYTFGYCKLGCAHEFDSELAKFFSKKNDVQSMLTKLNFALENPGWISWPVPGRDDDDPISTTSDFRDRLQSCIGEIVNGQIINEGAIHEAQDECYTSLARTQESCGQNFSCPEDCIFPEECRWDELWEEYDDLPDLAQSPPDWNSIIHYKRFSGEREDQLTTINDTICVLVGVSGRFQSGDDLIRIYQQSTHWWSEVRSSDNQTAGRSRGDFKCFPRWLFSDTGAGLIGTESKYMVLDFPYTLQGYHVGGEASVLSIGGIGGVFTSMDERVWSKRDYNLQNELTWWPTIRTGQDYLQAWFWSYQFDAPIDGHPRLWQGSDGMGPFLINAHRQPSTETNPVTKQLAPLDDGLCFLTNVQGEFAGTGEHARIRPAGEYWQLSVRTESDKEVKATATCVLYQQD